MHLARRATPKLAHIGGILAVFGLATLPGLLVTDFYDLALAQALPRAQSVAIADAAAGELGRRADGHAPAVAADVLRHRCVLAVAAVRAGVAPGWMPVRADVGWLAPFVTGTGLVPAVDRRRADPRRARPDRHQGRADERSGVGRAACGPFAHQAREGAEDRGRERRLIRHVPGVRRAGARLGHPGRFEQVRPGRVPAVERGLVELRMELDAPREAAEAERFRPAASRPLQELGGGGRRLDAVLVPVQAVRAGRELLEDRVVARSDVSGAQVTSRRGRRETVPPCASASSCAPRQTPRNGISRSTASRISSSSGSNCGSHADASPPKDTIPSTASSSGSVPKCSSTSPSGSAAWPRNGCCR